MKRLKKKRIFENIYLIYIHIYTHTYIFDRELLQLHSHTKNPNLKMGKQVSSEDEMYPRCLALTILYQIFGSCQDSTS